MADWTAGTAQELAALLTMAFEEVRLLGWDDEAKQAADLADSIVVLPTQMFAPEPDLAAFEGALRDYQARYPTREEEGLTFDYAAFLARLRSRGMATARARVAAGTTSV